MNLKLPPSTVDEIHLNIQVLDVLCKELRLLKSLFFGNLTEIREKGELIEQDVYIDDLTKSVLSVNNYSENSINIALNLNLKSFFFVYRQATSRILKLIFLSGNMLKIESGGKSFPDASQNSKFKKFIEDLVNNKFNNYDEDFINLLNNNRDAFIISRVIRNQIKSLGLFNVCLIDDDFRIIIPLGNDISKNVPTFEYIKQDFSLPNDQIRNLNWDQSYINDLYYSIVLFYNKLKELYGYTV